MPTGQELSDYASQHGWIIHPRLNQFGGADDWANELNNNGGMCPSTGQSCPCADAEAALSSGDVEDQHCAAYVFITPKYLQLVDPKGKTYGPIQDIVAPQSSPDTVELDIDPAVAEQLGVYREGVERTQKLFSKGDYETAFDELMTLHDGTECEVCKEEFATEAVHVNAVRNLCNLPGTGKGCQEEVKRVQDRLTKLHTLFSPNGQPAKKPAAAKKADKPQSQYRADMQAWMTSDELANLPQKAKFFIAGKLASGKASDVSEAEAMAIEAHPEWYA